MQHLSPRWFLTRNVHAPSGPVLLNPRYAMSWMRGPMTRLEIRRARGIVDVPKVVPSLSAADAPGEGVVSRQNVSPE